MAELNNNQFPLLSILIYIKGVWVIDTYTLLTDGSLKKVLTTGAGFLQILAPGDWVCHYEKPKGGQGRAKIGSRTERHRVRIVPRLCSSKRWFSEKRSAAII